MVGLWDMMSFSRMEPRLAGGLGVASLKWLLVFIHVAFRDLYSDCWFILSVFSKEISDIQTSREFMYVPGVPWKWLFTDCYGFLRILWLWVSTGQVSSFLVCSWVRRNLSSYCDPPRLSGKFCVSFGHDGAQRLRKGRPPCGHLWRPFVCAISFGLLVIQLLIFFCDQVCAKFAHQFLAKR